MLHETDGLNKVNTNAIKNNNQSLKQFTLFNLIKKKIRNQCYISSLLNRLVIAKEQQNKKNTTQYMNNLD
jgi:hypothetical protein